MGIPSASAKTSVFSAELASEELAGECGVSTDGELSALDVLEMDGIPAVRLESGGADVAAAELPSRELVHAARGASEMTITMMNPRRLRAVGTVCPPLATRLAGSCPIGPDLVRSMITFPLPIGWAAAAVSRNHSQPPRCCGRGAGAKLGPRIRRSPIPEHYRSPTAQHQRLRQAADDVARDGPAPRGSAADVNAKRVGDNNRLCSWGLSGRVLGVGHWALQW